MIVMKFGGTSLGNPERLQQAAEIVKSRIDKNPIVVVSAVGGITDNLIGAAKDANSGNDVTKKIDEIINTHHKILDDLNLDRKILERTIDSYKGFMAQLIEGLNLTKKELDVVQSYGERLSSLIFEELLNKNGIKAKRYAAYDVGFITDKNHCSAEVVNNVLELIKEKLSSIDHVAVVTGFIGKTVDGDITTLGRGGSDYTAALIGAALNAEAVEIWTDVDGIRRTDPKLIEHASTINQISFKEAAELAYFGAKVLHPKTILPAMDKEIPVRVLNTYNPDNNGTTIIKESPTPKYGIRAIAFKKDVIIINICSARMLNAYGFLEMIFGAFSDEGIVVDVISTSEVNVSLTTDNIYPEEKINSLVRKLKNLGNVTIKKNMSIVSCVGTNLGRKSELLGKIFSAIGELNINVEMVSAGASETNVTFLVECLDYIECVKKLHKTFFEQE